MSVKQEILKLARAAGLSNPAVKHSRNYWTLYAENPYQEDWNGDPRQEFVSTYFTPEQVQRNLPSDAQRFIEKIKREALEE
jgi:hypothetical protein